MLSEKCSICNRNKAPLTCGACDAKICKYCAEFLEGEQFYLLDKLPAKASHSTYCGHCYQTDVVPELENYLAMLEKAKEVIVFDKNQGKETRLIPRLEDPVKVTDCKDHNETILRLAFFAVKLGLNALVDVIIVPKKVKDGSYSTTIFSGTAVPAQVQQNHLLKDRSTWSNPN